MLHENTVFHGLLKHVPWPAFDRLVEQHRADAGVRRLTTKSQFLALLYDQLSGASSLRRAANSAGRRSATGSCACPGRNSRPCSRGSIGGGCTRHGSPGRGWPGELRPIDSPHLREVTSR